MDLHRRCVYRAVLPRRVRWQHPFDRDLVRGIVRCVRYPVCGARGGAVVLLCRSAASAESLLPAGLIGARWISTRTGWLVLRGQPVGKRRSTAAIQERVARSRTLQFHSHVVRANRRGEPHN
jgi:hypothetical protein